MFLVLLMFIILYSLPKLFSFSASGSINVEFAISSKYLIRVADSCVKVVVLPSALNSKTTFLIPLIAISQLTELRKLF